MFSNLKRFESRTYSQNGEDGILDRLFEIIGTTNRYFVEFGTGSDGRQRNTRLLEKNGWSGLLMDLRADEECTSIRAKRITAANINDLFTKYAVPDNFDLLSIDIDGNDYWVWNAIDMRYRPRVLVMEYNAVFPPGVSKTIEYDPDFMWNRTDYFGASLTALERLSRRKGYVLVYCERRGINAFFVRQDVLPEGSERPLEEIYREPDYAGGMLLGLARLYWPRGVGHKREKVRQMIDVE